MNELVYSVWLSLATTPGGESFGKLVSRFHTPENIYSADDGAIAAVIGSSSRDYKALVDKDLERAGEIVDFCTRKQVGILTYFDPRFPSSLKRIKNPPVLLYYRGKLPDFDGGVFISVVGTRRPTSYGRTNTFKIARDLALSGATVVSGMAVGIDGVALAGAISAGMPTVAVIGSGIDVCYPKSHVRLAREIVKLGCVMTEYAPGTQPDRHNFPTRNRIISGLSAATVVMEGSEKSGALITARRAKEQERAVYAFPGSVGNRNSEASNLLIKNGAKLITCADDVIRDFGECKPMLLNPFKLLDAPSVKIHDVLCEYKVSCVAVDDEVFALKRKRGEKSEKREASTTAEPVEKESNSEADAAKAEASVQSSFDKQTLELYKRIPIGDGCAIERLMCEGCGVREVMQGLLKLEIGGFVTMLPGERVKRK